MHLLRITLKIAACATLKITDEEVRVIVKVSLNNYCGEITIVVDYLGRICTSAPMND
jgi:hypothetical protein